ncbi:MAG: glycosyltransferase 61 family protein [Nocardioides sp.]
MRRKRNRLRGSGAESPAGGFDPLLPQRRQRTVVLLAHASQRQALAPWLSYFARDDVHVSAVEEAPEWDLVGSGATFHPTPNASKLNSWLKRVGAVDVMVVLLPATGLPSGLDSPLELWERFFRHLRRRGAFVVDRRVLGDPLAARELVALLSVMAAADDPQELRTLKRRDAELARATGSVAVSRDLIVATKRQQHFLKVKESNAVSLLSVREPDLQLREIAKRAPGSFTSRATVVSHGTAEPLAGMPTEMEYPALALRHYEGRVALAGATLMYAGHSVLPDSFRWHLTDNPGNPRLKSVSATFGVIESAYRPRRALEGNFYQLDCAYPGHFGHITTEVVSRLWGWQEAKELMPDLKVLFHARPQSAKPPSLELGLFRAYGIAEEDIVWTRDPVWVDSVVSATPMWHNAEPHYVHPDIAATWRRLSDGLATGHVAAADLAERIFVSRSEGAKHRECRNIREVESVFRARGYQIVYPERLPLSEQAAVFGAARIIAGFGGSALFNVMHARRLETMIILNHEAYTARNEHLFTSVIGADVHYFWSAPDIPHGDTWSEAAFYSDWEFDFERNGAELAGLLDRL